MLSHLQQCFQGFRALQWSHLPGLCSGKLSAEGHKPHILHKPYMALQVRSKPTSKAIGRAKLGSDRATRRVLWWMPFDSHLSDTSYIHIYRLPHGQPNAKDLRCKDVPQRLQKARSRPVHLKHRRRPHLFETRSLLM